MRTPKELLQDLIHHIERADSHKHLSLDEFEDSDMRDAVLYNLIIIGEIVKLLPEEIKNKHSDYAWNEVARFRDRAVHHYHKTSDKLIWETIRENLLPLKRKVELILSEIEQDPTLPED